MLHTINNIFTFDLNIRSQYKRNGSKIQKLRVILYCCYLKKNSFCQLWYIYSYMNTSAWEFQYI